MCKKKKSLSIQPIIAQWWCFCVGSTHRNIYPTPVDARRPIIVPGARAFQREGQISVTQQQNCLFSALHCKHACSWKHSHFHYFQTAWVGLFVCLPVTDAVRVQLYRIASSPNTFPGPMVHNFLPCLVISTIPSAYKHQKHSHESPDYDGRKTLQRGKRLVSGREENDHQRLFEWFFCSLEASAWWRSADVQVEDRLFSRMSHRLIEERSEGVRSVSPSWTNTPFYFRGYASRQWLHHDVTSELGEIFHLNASSDYFLPENTHISERAFGFLNFACFHATVQGTTFKKGILFVFFFTVSACFRKYSVFLCRPLSAVSVCSHYKKIPNSPAAGCPHCVRQAGTYIHARPSYFTEKRPNLFIPFATWGKIIAFRIILAEVELPCR